MENIEIKQLIEIDEDNLNKMTKWIYEWWGNNEAFTLEQIKVFLKNCMQKDRLPQTYGAFIRDSIIGMYQFTYEDLFVRPDIYPWLANVYVDEKYRGKGVCRKMLESVKGNAKQNTQVNELWLYTKHINLYDKFGWEYVGNIDTCIEEQRVKDYIN